MKNIIIEMNPNMDNLQFLIDNTKYTFPIPEVIKQILPISNKFKIFFKMFYEDGTDTDKKRFMIMQYTDGKGNVVFEEKHWSLCV